MKRRKYAELPNNFSLSHHPREIYDRTERNFKELCPVVFRFLETDYGFISMFHGQNIGILYQARMEDLEIIVVLDKYIVDAEFRFYGEKDLRLVQARLFEGARFLTMEDCFYPDFVYKGPDWENPNYVKDQLELYAGILKKYIDRLLGDDYFEFMKEFSQCLDYIGPEVDPACFAS